MTRALRQRKVTKAERNKTDPPRLRAPGRREVVAQRQADAMRLRVAGAPFSGIARQLGTSKQQAWRDVRAALAETLTQRDGDASAYRELELARLDALTVACWQAAQRGSAEHVRAIVRISERRSRLLGLDAVVAQKLELTGARGGPIAMDDQRPYEHLTTAQILARIETVRTRLRETVVDEEALRAMDANVALVPVANPPTPEEKYAAVLAERQRERRTN